MLLCCSCEAGLFVAVFFAMNETKHIPLVRLIVAEPLFWLCILVLVLCFPSFSYSVHTCTCIFVVVNVISFASFFMVT